jgi:hypothetical protein
VIEMAIAELEIAAKLGKSDRMIRNYAKTIEQVTGANPQAGPREYHDWALAEFEAIVSAGGPKAYERQYQSQPVATVTEPQPEPVAQPQPAAVAFQIVPLNPAAELAIAPQSVGPSNLIPFAPIAQQAATNIQSTQFAITAARQLVHGVRSRLATGNETAWAQQQQITDQIAALDLEITQLEVEGQLYRQQQIRTQAVQHLAGDEVGKRIARLSQLAAANGYQLQPQ